MLCVEEEELDLLVAEPEDERQAVGMSCSPGRIQRIGPSLDSVGDSILSELIGPQGIT